MTFSKKMNRRSFLYCGSSLLASLALFGPSRTLALSSQTHPLSFYHTHTGECLNIEFCPAQPDKDTLEQVNHFLRDFRSGEVHPIDTELLATLCLIQNAGSNSGTFEIISGYRSPHTNARLRKASSGVARRSLHMSGKAVDVRLRSMKTTRLRDLAHSLKRGGVGYYAKSDFVHIDTGRVRNW